MLDKENYLKDVFCALDWPPGLYSWRKCILLLHLFIQRVYFSLPQSTSVPYPSFSSCPRIFITFCQLNLMSQMRYWRKICIGLEEGALSHLHLNLTWIWWEAGYYWTQMKKLNTEQMSTGLCGCFNTRLKLARNSVPFCIVIHELPETLSPVFISGQFNL